MPQLPRAAGVAAFCLAVAACAPTPPPVAAAPARTTIEIPLAIAPPAAIERVKSAFVAEGLTIGTADGGVIVSMPAYRSTGGTARVEITYRATVLEGPEGSRVVLSGTARASDVTTATRDVPLTSDGTYGPEGEYHGWQKLERIATALQR